MAADVLGEGDPTPARPALIAKVRSLLRQGAPASGVQLWPAQDTSDAHLLRGDEERRRAAYLSAVDVPATDAELLEAAWLEELDRDVADSAEDLRRSLLAPDRTLDEEALDCAAGLLAKRDTALSRSLQAAAVHQCCGPPGSRRSTPAQTPTRSRACWTPRSRSS